MEDKDFDIFKKLILSFGNVIVFNSFRKELTECYGKKSHKARKEVYDELIIKFKKIIADKNIAYNSCDGFEFLTKTKEQNEKYPNLDIFRYEIRKYSNLRCLFIIDRESEYIYLLGAFIEDDSKKKRKK
ncbi:MAG: hypothetical protein IJ272_04155 [Clostridia bacterium]|nr:hypothetical protein [Clostridia bacterium]